MSRLTRRQFAGGCAALLTVPASLLTRRGAQAQAATRVRCFWWGNPERDRRTRAALDAYRRRRACRSAPSCMGWGDYWTKLATQTAGGNAPDLIQMDYRYIYEYARRNTLLALERSCRRRSI